MSDERMTEVQLQLLHDRATRGERLTLEEQADLDEWYREQDEAEIRGLQGQAGTVHDQQAPPLVTAEQVTNTVVQLEATAQHIREVTAENDRLRAEIAALRRQLAQRLAGQAA